jgi:hypothetical protein
MSTLLWMVTTLSSGKASFGPCQKSQCQRTDLDAHFDRHALVYGTASSGNACFGPCHARQKADVSGEPMSTLVWMVTTLSSGRASSGPDLFGIGFRRLVLEKESFECVLLSIVNTAGNASVHEYLKPFKLFPLRSEAEHGCRERPARLAFGVPLQSESEKN